MGRLESVNLFANHNSCNLWNNKDDINNTGYCYFFKELHGSPLNPFNDDDQNGLLSDKNESESHKPIWNVIPFKIHRYQHHPLCILINLKFKQWSRGSCKFIIQNFTKETEVLFWCLSGLEPSSTLGPLIIN